MPATKSRKVTRDETKALYDAKKIFEWIINDPFPKDSMRDKVKLWDTLEELIHQERELSCQVSDSFIKKAELYTNINGSLESLDEDSDSDELFEDINSNADAISDKIDEYTEVIKNCERVLCDLYITIKEIVQIGHISSYSNTTYLCSSDCSCRGKGLGSCFGKYITNVKPLFEKVSRAIDALQISPNDLNIIKYKNIFSIEYLAAKWTMGNKFKESAILSIKDH